jgi:NAD(P)H-hydrate epimerase
MKQINEIPKLPNRSEDGHKGTFGKVLIIAGSFGMSGAAGIAGKSALKAGAGLVRVATATTSLPMVAGIDPCYTTIPLPEDDSGKIAEDAIHTILREISKNDCTAFGCGTGQSRELKSITEKLVRLENIRLIIDGDGLNNLSKITGFRAVGDNIVLTPHPGEMERLWSVVSREPVPEDRKECAARLAEKTNTTVVLKGAGTVVSNSQKIYVNDTGNPGMATGGSGDCLTGVITALAGQGLDMFDACVLGVYVHGKAGDITAENKGQIGMTAADIVDALPQVFMKL